MIGRPEECGVTEGRGVAPRGSGDVDEHGRDVMM